MDFDVARHGVALKTVVPTCPFARFRYGIGRDEGPSRADRKKKGNRVNDPVSQGHWRPSRFGTEALLRTHLMSKNGYK
jgi:hypothetical protein